MSCPRDVASSTSGRGSDSASHVETKVPGAWLGSRPHRRRAGRTKRRRLSSAREGVAAGERCGDDTASSRNGRRPRSNGASQDRGGLRSMGNGYRDEVSPPGTACAASPARTRQHQPSRGGGGGAGGGWEPMSRGRALLRTRGDLGRGLHPHVEDAGASRSATRHGVAWAEDSLARSLEWKPSLLLV